MQEINKYSATTYKNNVQIKFDWESNTDVNDPQGNCWAHATLTWNPRIEEYWRKFMSQGVGDVLYPQYRSRADGKPKWFFAEINEEYDNIEYTEIPRSQWN